MRPTVKEDQRERALRLFQEATGVDPFVDPAVQVAIWAALRGQFLLQVVHLVRQIGQKGFGASARDVAVAFAPNLIQAQTLDEALLPPVRDWIIARYVVGEVRKELGFQPRKEAAERVAATISAALQKGYVLPPANPDGSTPKRPRNAIHDKLTVLLEYLWTQQQRPPLEAANLLNLATTAGLWDTTIQRGYRSWGTRLKWARGVLQQFDPLLEASEVANETKYACVDLYAAIGEMVYGYKLDRQIYPRPDHASLVAYLLERPPKYEAITYARDASRIAQTSS